MANWPEAAESIRTGLEKLATHGTPDQIRDHLVEQGLTGIRNNGRSCIVAEYLVHHGYAQRDQLSVRTLYSSVTTFGESPYNMKTTGGIPHPQPVEDLIRRFDNGRYPELIDPELDTA